MAKPPLRKCGTCRFWPGNPKSSAIHDCRYPVPAPPTLPWAFQHIVSQAWKDGNPHSYGVDRSDGVDCPTWELREAQQPKEY